MVDRRRLDIYIYIYTVVSTWSDITIIAIIWYGMSYIFQFLIPICFLADSALGIVNITPKDRIKHRNRYIAGIGPACQVHPWNTL